MSWCLSFCKDFCVIKSRNIVCFHRKPTGGTSLSFSLSECWIKGRNWSSFRFLSCQHVNMSVSDFVFLYFALLPPCRHVFEAEGSLVSGEAEFLTDQLNFWWWTNWSFHWKHLTNKLLPETETQKQKSDCLYHFL